MRTFLVRQKIQLIGNEYRVYEATGDDNEELMVAYARQKILALKEKFTFFADDNKQSVAFELQARQVMDFGARYDVRDASGELIGTIGKAFKASLFRSTWNIYAPGKEEAPIFVARERSKKLAISRRLWGLLPYIGELPFFLKYHFDFIDPKTEKVYATYNKIATIRDHYKLSAKESILEVADWRVLVATAVMMDALQDR